MSWDTLIGIRREAADRRQQEDAAPPVACPNDGEPLEADKDGNLRCHFDGWSWRP